MKILSVIAITLILYGCTTTLQVEKLQEFKPDSKTFILLTDSIWDTRIRSELTKRGFKVLKFATTNKVISTGKDDTEFARIYNEAEARYGISFSYDVVDRCIYNSSRLINGLFEITDIRQNEVLLLIETGGWTGPCADPRGMVFEDFAKALSDVWAE